MLSLFVMFFFKQKTAYEMRISDWSSDVCSSDLLLVAVGGVMEARPAAAAGLQQQYQEHEDQQDGGELAGGGAVAEGDPRAHDAGGEVGHAEEGDGDRKSVV